MSGSFLTVEKGPGPVIAVANHHGHVIRPEVARLMTLDAVTRLREEDPITGEWAGLVPTCLVAQHSRFEIDLNRPRESAVYLAADDAWGLQVWKQPPPDSLIEASLAQYDAYYNALELLCREKQETRSGYT
jgi:N-formylglutamate amidohydrolase